MDENKSPEQIKQEVSSMDQAEISKMVELYTVEIEKKSVALKAEADKLSNIPLTSMFGDEAKGIKANMAEINASIEKLTANMQAYADGLKNK